MTDLPVLPVYVTIGGAHVVTKTLAWGEGLHLDSFCVGCFANWDQYTPSTTHHEVNTAHSIRAAKDWCQKHAERCRALPAAEADKLRPTLLEATLQPARRY